MAAAILLFCFQGAGRAPKRSGDLVQRERRNKVLRGSVHQVRADRLPKRPGDLVQRGRKNKALRGSVHQVRAGRAPKRSGDLVQRERKNKVLRGFVHQPRAENRKGRPGHRPSWRPIAGKALCLRCEAPTFCPGAQPVTGRVGAPLPAKPVMK